MNVIAISGPPFSGDSLLAESLADSLGYRIIEPAVVVERAAAWSASHQELNQALTRRPRIWDRFLRRGWAYLIVLQAALAEELRGGRAICYGNLSDLLPSGDGFLLRIRIEAPLEFRTKMVQERFKLGPAESLDLLRQFDRDKQGWLRNLYGAGWRETLRHDLLIDLGRMQPSEAAAIAAQLVQGQYPVASEQLQQAALDNLALSSRLRAALACCASTAHLDLDVAAESGLVSISGKIPGPNELREVQRIVSQVPGVVDFVLNGVKPGTPEGQPAGVSAFLRKIQRLSAWKPLRPTWVAISLILCLVLASSWVLNKLGSTVFDAAFARVYTRTFTGVITDTICAGKVSMDAQCAKRCVRLGKDVKYALYDGGDVYVLSDQAGAERYAAQRVQVRGVLDASAKTLRVASIKPSL
jgi:cytidylate kinase